MTIQLLLAALLAHTALASSNQTASFLVKRGCHPTSHLGVSGLPPDVAKLASSTTHAEELHEVVCKVLWGWNITALTPGQEASSSNSIVARTADEHALAAHLHQVLEVAEKLLHVARSCSPGNSHSRSGSSGADKGCPAVAPELLHGGTAAFLASMLHNYPRGPTSREELTAWAGTATSFLHEHRRLQRQQRQAAAQAAGAAADIAAFSAAGRAAARDDGPSGGDGHEGDGVERHTGGDEGGIDAGGLHGDDSDSRRTLTAATGSAAGGGDGGSSAAGDDGRRDRGLSDLQGSGGVDRGASDGDDEDGGEGDDGNADNTGGDSSRAPPQIPANFTGLPYGGLPLVRRVLLAQLLLGWMAAERQDAVAGAAATATAAEAHQELSRLVPLLYDIHVESVAQRAVMEYFHISKAGGTSWTAAAAASGCERPRSNAARDRDFDDDCRWINGTLLRQYGIHIRRTAPMQVCSRFDVSERQSHIRDCVGRLRHALASGFQYVSNEYTLHGGSHDMYGTHICPQFVNVISIREPLERLASNVKYMLVRLRATLFRKPPAAKYFPKVFCNAPASLWEEYAPPVADNYNIRTLVGERGFHAPLYGIGEAHEAIAKQLLLQYDLILDLNAGDHAADLLMKEGLGWNKTLAEVRVWTLDRLAKKTGLDLEEGCRVGDLTPLLEKQVYDQRWYSFGRTLSRLDQLFLSAAAQLGRRPWPGDWAEEMRGPAGAAALSDRDLSGRCGLLGSVETLRQQQRRRQQ